MDRFARVSSTTFPSGSATCSVRSPHGRSVGQASTQTRRLEPCVLRVDVLDEERDLALRPRRRIGGRAATDQRRQLAARKQHEPHALGRELRAASARNRNGTPIVSCAPVNPGARNGDSGGIGSCERRSTSTKLSAATLRPPARRSFARSTSHGRCRAATPVRTGTDLR